MSTARGHKAFLAIQLIQFSGPTFIKAKVLHLTAYIEVDKAIVEPELQSKEQP